MSRGSGADGWARLVSVAAREWGLSPDEVRSRGARRALLLADGLALLAAMSADPAGAWAVGWVCPAIREAARRRTERKRQLLAFARMVQGPGVVCDNPEYLEAARRAVLDELRRR